jgi:hypothetical protein
MFIISKTSSNLWWPAGAKKDKTLFWLKSFMTIDIKSKENYLTGILTWSKTLIFVIFLAKLVGKVPSFLEKIIFPYNLRLYVCNLNNRDKNVTWHCTHTQLIEFVSHSTQQICDLLRKKKVKKLKNLFCVQGQLFFLICV